MSKDKILQIILSSVKEAHWKSEVEITWRVKCLECLLKHPVGETSDICTCTSVPEKSRDSQLTAAHSPSIGYAIAYIAAQVKHPTATCTCQFGIIILAVVHLIASCFVCVAVYSTVLMGFGGPRNHHTLHGNRRAGAASPRFYAVPAFDAPLQPSASHSLCAT